MSTTRRPDGSRDATISPTSEARLEPIALIDGNNYVIGLNNESEDFVDPIAESPQYLIVTADGDFYAGQEIADSAINELLLAGVRYSFPVNRRTQWNFRRDGEETVNIRGVLYMAE